MWQHAERALAVIEKRVIPGTSLAAYGHGDWNDSLQPADPAMREHLCSAWTVTLHVQTLTTLAHALRTIGRADDAAPLETGPKPCSRISSGCSFADGVLAGYALFEDGERVRYLLHPSDATTGVRYSSLAMIHAILEDMLTPDAGARAPAPDRRAPERRRTACACSTARCRTTAGRSACSSAPRRATFFGREIGLMYMHAHLRYAQALAHIGRGGALLSCAVPGEPDRHPLDRAERDAAPGELLLLQLRRRVRGPLSGECGLRARRDAARLRSTAAGACIRAARASRSG